MGYSRLFLAVLFLLFLPQRGLPAESASSGFGSSATSSAGSGADSGTDAAMGTFPTSSTPVAGVGAAPSITTSASDAKELALRDSALRTEDQSQIAQGKITPVKSSFQSFVESATGRKLDVFGRELFRNVPSTFSPLNAVQVNPDYVIGSGDVLQIRGWGMVSIDVNAIVSRNGDIYLPRVGSINVAGVKYRDLQGYLKKAVGRIFKNFELSASVLQTRSVQIYVVGHALRPGAYTLGSMSTLLNALFASGGPSVTGSMRNIKLNRGGEQPVTFDLYDILLHGDKSSDLPLKDGDVIHIQSVGPLVALFGDVKNSAIYELKQKNSLAEIVEWAGGFEAVSGVQNVIIEKSVDNHYQTVAELKSDLSSIEKKLEDIHVNPTDIIRVVAPGAAPLEVKVEREFVRVDGEVKESGVFELVKGETLRAFVARIGGVTDKAYVFGTRLNRESVRREQQQKIDESVDRYEKDIDANAKQRLSGSSDPSQGAVIAAELDSQRNLVKRLRMVKSEGRIILNLKDFNANIGDLPDFPLQNGDVVYIPEKPSTVNVIGAVYQQNAFMYQSGRYVNDYVQLAGGVSSTGDKSEMYRICADGTARSNRQGGYNGVINPGDAIVVPEKIQRGAGLVQNLKDFTSILYQFGLGAAGLATLKTL
ncbi:MAG: SLBB domain-containing protein [Chlorobium sp.]